jgi:alpha-galactosidase
VELVQIDDGFEANVGDWFDFAPTFPDGVAPLANEIQAAGFTPGLWLAPFILLRRSRLYREHPDWLLRGQFNRPVNAGFIWDSFTTASISRTRGVDYVRRTSTQQRTHGLSIPELISCMPGRWPGDVDATLSRAQSCRALELGRTAARDIPARPAAARSVRRWIADAAHAPT